MPAKTKVEDIMTRDVFTVTLDDTLQKVDEIMRNEKVRHVPVIDEGKFIGLITERTIMEYTLLRLYEYDDNFGAEAQNKISDYRVIMEKNVRIIFPEDSIQKAIEMMSKYKLECIPVVDWKHYLVGIVTSIDVMLFINKKLKEGVNL
jgi:CBS domain-containing protein